MSLLIAVGACGRNVGLLARSPVAPGLQVFGRAPALARLEFGQAIGCSKDAEMALPHWALAVDAQPLLALKRGAADL